MEQYYLAIDIGASSGRHILGHLDGGRLILEEVHRFENRQLRRDGHDCWDLDRLWNGILEGLKRCGASGRVPETVGIDTWGVDYVLLDEKDRPLGGAVSYRDSRTHGVPALVEQAVSSEELYARTGIQRQDFNTIYQLYAQTREAPEKLKAACSLLMIPDYFGFLLTGEKRQEYTNATTAGLVNAALKTWDLDLIRRLGLPEKLFGPLSMPGTAVGHLRPEIQREVGFDTQVVLPASHDTGSAFLAVPAKDEHSVFLSSGTWSLLGVENREPLTSESSRKANFTNEGGAWKRFRYLKNIMGLWMIQSIRRELNGTSYVDGKASGPAGDWLWRFSDGGKFTSELPAHLMSHAARLKVAPRNRVVMHCHPANLLAMTYVHDLDERAFTRTLWQMCTECVVVFPDGVNVLPWMLCGTNEIGEATAEKMKTARLVVWAQHGIYGAGADLDETFGLIETAEKAAEIYMKIAHLPLKNTISDEALRKLVRHFGVMPRPGWIEAERTENKYKTDDFLAGKIEGMVKELMAGPGAVRATLKQYLVN